VWFYVLVIGLACVGVVAALWATKARGAWGSRRSDEAIEVGSGPYRAQRTAPDEPLPVPRPIWITATMSAVWGLITTFFFVPAGALLLIVFVDGAPRPASVLAGLALIAIVASGVGVGVSSMAAAFGLMRRSEGIAGLTRALSRWSLAHHCVVPVYFAALSIATGDSAVFVWNIPFVWFPCAFGMWHAARLESAHALTAEPVPMPA
jgi:hypothetical protein